MKQLLLPAILLLAASPASAQMVVIGEGAATGCYQSALTGNSGTRTAIRECDEALKLATLTRRDRAATYVNRGVLLMRKGDQDLAVADYDAALDMNPELPEAHINRGVALYFSGDLKASLAAYDTALEIGSDKDALAHFNRALVHERMENAPAAYRDFKRASELDPDWDQPREALTRFTVTRRTS